MSLGSRAFVLRGSVRSRAALVAVLIAAAPPVRAQGDEAAAREQLARLHALAPELVAERVAAGREALAQLAPASRTRVACGIRLALGEALLDALEFGPAIAELRAGCELAREHDARTSLAIGLVHLGTATANVGDFAAAVAAAREAAALAVEFGRGELEFVATNLLGVACERGGDRDGAVVAWTRCIELAEQRADERALLTVLNNLSVVRMNAGQLDAARADLRRARALAESLGDKATIAVTLANEADVECLAGCPDVARDHHLESLRLREQLGVPLDIALAQSQLAGVLIDLRDASGALALLDKALPVQQQAGVGPEIVATLRRMSRAYSALDRPADAVRAATAGVELAGAIDNKARRVRVLSALADAHAANDQPALALQAMRDAFALDEEVDSLELLSSFAAREAELTANERERHIAMLEKDRALAASELERHRLWRISLLLGAGGLSVIALLGWSRYLHRRRAHQALARTRAIEQQLADSRRLESLSVVSGGLAHDFNNLLTGILGNAELARLAANDPEMVCARLDDVTQACRRAAALADEMLTLSGRGNLHTEPVDLDDLVRRSVRLVLGAFPGRQVTLELAGDLPPIDGDPDQLGRVVHNLVANALEANGAAPAAVVVLTRVARRADGTASEVILEVRDHGAGLSEAARQHLFEPFFTTKRGGRGLGLAVVHGVVQRHRGHVSVGDAIGGGARFVVALPAAEAARGAVASEGAAAVVPAAAPSGAHHRTVLVIDDEATVRDTTAGLLASLDHEVVLADGGAAGLAALERARAEIGAVLLDLRMPGMSGQEVLPRLRAIAPDVPVALITGYDRDGLADRLCREHHARLLAKPFGREALRETLDAMLGGELPHSARAGGHGA